MFLCFELRFVGQLGAKNDLSKRWKMTFFLFMLPYKSINFNFGKKAHTLVKSRFKIYTLLLGFVLSLQRSLPEKNTMVLTNRFQSARKVRRHQLKPEENRGRKVVEKA